MKKALQRFDQIFSKATAAIKPDYFQLPVAGLENAQYRERVYCYELYHQMRRRWPSGFPFSLAGEVDKGGHPLIRGNKLDRVKPDFIVHIPGDMDHNLLVMEVKALVLDAQQKMLQGFEEKIVTDLEKLTAFRRAARYHAAYYLFYSEDLRHQQHSEALTSICRSLARNNKNVDLSLIILLLHKRAGTSAVNQPWR